MRIFSYRSLHPNHTFGTRTFSCSLSDRFYLIGCRRHLMRVQIKYAPTSMVLMRRSHIPLSLSLLTPMISTPRLYSTTLFNRNLRDSFFKKDLFTNFGNTIKKKLRNFSQLEMPETSYNAEAASEKLKLLVGLDDKNAKDLSTKAERVENLISFFEKYQLNAETPRQVKVMMFSVWTKVKSDANRDILASYIINGKLSTTQKVDAAINYVNATGGGASTININELEKECGVGVQINEMEVHTLVKKALEAEDSKALKTSWEKNQNMLIGKMRRVPDLRWAEVEHIKSALEANVPELIKNVKIDVMERSGIDSKPTLTAQEHSAKKDVKLCPYNADFKAIAKGLPATRIKELESFKEGSLVYFLGWSHRVRHQSRMSFVVMRDGTGYVQCVFDGTVEPFHRETSLAIRGRVQYEPKAKGDFQPPIEIHVLEYSVVGKSDGSIETVITAESSLDKLLDHRHILHRGTVSSSTLKVRHEMLRVLREFLWSKNYYEVTPPTLVQSECESGSTVFEMLYYNEKAYLTQSSQLYLETVTASLGNVFCCLPSYRAEKSKTKRHLSEYTHLEVEYDICDFEDLLDRLEELITFAFDTVISRVGHLVAFLNPSQVINLDRDLHDPSNYRYRPQRPFRRIRYSDAIEYCNANGILNPETGEKFKFGEDITDQPERAMVAKMNQFVLMTHFPAALKSFYMQRDPENPILTESVDVLAPGVGEIVGGSMRMWDFDELLEVYKQQNIDPSLYYWYFDQRRYGSVPHGGFGLGIERLLVWLLNLDSVKEACLYPRYMGRCKP